MPLLIRGLLEPDGVTPILSSTRYIVSGPNSPGYIRFPEQPWDSIHITANEISIPDRDYANARLQPLRSQLAEFVEKGFVSVSLNDANGAFAFAAGTVTLTTTVVVFLPSMVGQPISIAGATSPGNDGAFTIASYIGPTQVTYVNATGVTEAGAGSWAVPLTPDQIRDYS